MDNQMLCFDCLTDDNRSVPAVTTFNGTTYCEKCAREHAETMAQMQPFAPPSPLSGGPGGGRQVGGF